MSRIVVPIGSDVYVFDDDSSCGIVQRIGRNEFKSAFDDKLEALRLFSDCVGAAYLRTSFPEYVETRAKLEKEAA